LFGFHIIEGVFLVGEVHAGNEEVPPLMGNEGSLLYEETADNAGLHLQEVYTFGDGREQGSIFSGAMSALGYFTFSVSLSIISSFSIRIYWLTC
jgi:hypothetical protein